MPLTGVGWWLIGHDPNIPLEHSLDGEKSKNFARITVPGFLTHGADALRSPMIQASSQAVISVKKYPP